jgi:uncharacterized DUF497 family protein
MADKFEWDEQKRLANARKHGIGFADAVSIFEGDIMVVLDEGQTRYIAFGLLQGNVIV